MLKVDRRDAYWPFLDAPRFRGLDISDQIFSRGLKTQIHEVSAFLAFAGEPLAPKGEQASDQSGADRTDRTSDGDNKSYVFSLHVILIAGLSGLVVSLLICVPLGFAMWWFERAPFGWGNIQKNRHE
jgi:hypothetical protein